MNKVDIYEVGPRDGFQNVKEYIPLETKLKVIDGLMDAGMKHVQITSFVSPKAIPQMKDAREVTETCLAKYPDADFHALVPNLRGAQNAWKAGLRSISYVVSLSISHNQANIRRTHEESFEELRKIQEAYPEMDICLDLATAFGCPFEGMKYADEVVSFLKPYADCGIKVFNLCDTVGMANPAQVRETIDAVTSAYPDAKLMVHIHDTRGMGMAQYPGGNRKGRDQSTVYPGRTGGMSLCTRCFRESGYRRSGPYADRNGV